ncbi:RHS repeat-associated core domain-containing protein [Izhakiella capsodis]|uniref:RHS repeat-associated core domain-containing protein n=1 Tax=Izhakiella capsodis TaxID=1367852 RepID=A0A1I4ZR27_9GAMM|nr:RHS repeat-associated core domain-containing protein [Izhakiella capsodis]SFN52726.1 RHS repeat-associated core domain-containing protein [Izhakiella capsodis]
MINENQAFNLLEIASKSPEFSSSGNTAGVLINEPKPNVSASGHNPLELLLIGWGFYKNEEKKAFDKIKDYVHTGLDLAGGIPEVGAVFDGANAALYAEEGNYEQAAISLGSAALDLVPGVGTGAKITKYSVKGGMAVSKAVIKTAEKVGLEQAEKTALKQLEKGALKETTKTAEKGALKTSEKEIVKTEEKQAVKNAEKKTGDASTQGKAEEDGIAVKDSKNKQVEKDCPGAGHPVNPISGIKFLTGEAELDFVLSAPLSLFWQRSYFSDQTGNGWLGQGWSLPFSWRLLRQTDGMRLIDSQGRVFHLPILRAGQSHFDRHEQLFFSREDNGRYCVTTSDCRLRYLFSPLAAGEEDPQGERALYLPLTGIEDANGNLIRLFYDDAGLPHMIQDAAGRWLKLAFITLSLPDGQQVHRLQKVILMKKQEKDCSTETQVSYGYSDEGDLISVLDAQGQICREFRYTNHILTEHRQPGGLIARYEYDIYTPKGKVVRHTTNLGQVWRFDYSDGETRVTDPLGRVTHYQYNSARAFIGFVDANGQTTQATLDTLGRPVTFALPGGGQTHHTYEPYGKLTSRTDTAGNRTTFRYDNRQRLSAITDVMQQTTHYEYCTEDNAMSVINPLGQRTDYLFNNRGLTTAITCEDVIRCQMRYNAEGQLVSWTDCSGYVTRLTYQHEGRVTTLKFPDGTQTIVTYNAQGKRLSSLFADGSGEYNAYDQYGRLTERRNVLGAQTVWQLDLDGLPLKRINSHNENFSYHYDAARRLVKLTNENAADYHIEYDNNDNILREKGFDNGVTGYRYDAAGKLIEKTEYGSPASATACDPNAPGILTTFRYNDQGLIIEKIIRNAAQNTSAHSYFDYNAAGFLILARNSHSTVTRRYNALNQLVSETSETMGKSQTLQHQYASHGQRSQTLLPDGKRIDYLYYGSGHLLQINLDGKPVCMMERDKMHREVFRSQGLLSSHFSYSPIGQLTTQHVAADAVSDFSAPVISRHYQYDKAGNLQLMHDQYEGVTQYRYDSQDRLISAGSECFSFDPAGNPVEPGVSTSENRVMNNRLIRYQNNHYRYDRYGNLQEKITGDGKHLYLYYDPEHQLERLTMISNGRQQTTVYGYDALGRRIYKKHQDNTVMFLWDEDRLVNETQTDQTRIYLYPPASFIPLAQIVQRASMEPEIYYYHTDQIGTPREMTSSEGKIVWRTGYMAWGKTRIHDRSQKNKDASPAQSLRFQGQYYDEESGLHYNRYRYYDPDTGRFISQDPLGLAGGENSYQYAPNPTVWVDPLGLMNTSGVSGDSSFSQGSIGKASYEFDTKTKNLTIKTHGAPFATQTDRLASGASLTKQIKNVINKEGGYVNRVTMQSCYSAYGGPASQAQQLANNLNTPVTGYTGKFTEEVRVGASRPLGGDAKTFQPSTSNIGKNVSKTLNKAGNNATKGAYNVSKLFKGSGN